MKKITMLLFPLLLTGCLLESVGPIDRSIKPYGAHWYQEGMTRQSRRIDSWACGALRTVTGADHPVFPKDELIAAQLPSDPNSILAIHRLGHKLQVQP